MADNPSFPVSTAAISWVDNAGSHIRVYSSDGYNVVERCADPNIGWTAGAFSQQGSDVSATCWQDDAGVHIRVYCTFEDTTTEWCTDPGEGWSKGGYTQP